MLLPAGAVLSVVPGAGLAKEHTAACDGLIAVLGRVRASVDAAGFQRRRGSSLGAYQTLRATAASIVRDTGGAETCGAIGPTLEQALRRAALSRTAVEATVELDLGLDAAMALVTSGRPPHYGSPPKLPPVGEAVEYGQACSDIFPVALRLEGPAASLPARIRVVLEDLRAHPRCEHVKRLLEETPPARLPHAVDSIRLDEPDEPGGELSVHARCPELPILVERLAAAIEIGAPTYNAGDAEGCRRLYAETARAALGSAIGEGRCPASRALLEEGLRGAAAAGSAREGAWALRHAFDAVLAGSTAGPGSAGTP